MLESIRIAVRAITRNALRAALTVLGILIGVAAVVTVTALGAGARAAVSRQIDAIGSNLIFVSPQATAASGARGRVTQGRLTEEDARAVLRDSVSVAQANAGLQSRAQVVWGDSNTTTNISGVMRSFFDVQNWKFAHGGMWDEHDEATKAKVCVLGETVREHLFGNEDPVGRVVRIGKYPYRVVGVLAPKGDAFGNDQDDIVVVPIAGMRSRFVRTSPGQVYYIAFQARSADTTDRAVQQITEVLRQRHHIREGAEPDFQIRTQKEIQELQTTVFTVLTALLVAAAAISLVVGGIGIMNIMLVSVTERTREIGIRMAIGARAADIRTQFLVEAVVLSMLGGLAGAAIGGAIIAGLGRALGWPMGMSPTALTVAVGVSAAIGVAFGFFPARNASQLDPIEALRHE